MKYSQTLIDGEYESSNIASQKEIGRLSGNLDLSHTRYTHLYKLYCGSHCNKYLKNVTGIIGDCMGIK